MANTWARSDNARFSDVWYMGLPVELRLTYTELICFSALGYGLIPTTNLEVIASRIGMKPKNITDLIKVSGGRVVLTDKGIEIKNYRKWNPASDAERQAKSREKRRQQSQQSHADVTPMSQQSHTEVTPTIRYDTIRNDNGVKAVAPVVTPRASARNEPPTADDGHGASAGELLAKSLTEHQKNGAKSKSETRTVCEEIFGLIGNLNDNDRAGIWHDFQKAAAAVGLEPLRRIVGEMREVEGDPKVINPIGLVRGKIQKCYQTQDQ